jgi:hypothetical protein
MLSEGWDAKTVTHIMGLRAFSSQLLCEQVVGRGLRRTSYEAKKMPHPITGEEVELFEPEYVNIFGVPFTFLPHEGGEDGPLPPSGACVGTLQKAAQMALADKSNGDPVFKFARAVKAFELTMDARLPEKELPGAFNVWWSMAESILPPDTDREECLYLFMDAYDKAKHPLGSNVIQNALDRVKSSSPPPEANRYESPKLKILVHLCYELQRLAGDSPFFLSVRDAARAVGLSVKSVHVVSAFMHGLHRDGIIKPVEIGKPGGCRATRYRYVAN